MKKNFQKRYRELFAQLEFPLAARDAVSETQIARHETRLGIKLPQALRDYYRVAGRARRFNLSFNRLLAPADWTLAAGKLIFMEENQAVVVWGVTAKARGLSDPCVYQSPSVEGENEKWHVESKLTSTFLEYFLILQASYGGGMPFTAAVSVPDDSANRFKQGWRFAGAIDGMNAFYRRGAAVCVAEWSGFGNEKLYRVCAGSRTQAGLDQVAETLKLTWEQLPTPR